MESRFAHGVVAPCRFPPMIHWGDANPSLSCGKKNYGRKAMKTPSIWCWHPCSVAPLGAPRAASVAGQAGALSSCRSRRRRNRFGEPSDLRPVEPHVSQSFVIDNKGGAGGKSAPTELARGRPMATRSA